MNMNILDKAICDYKRSLEQLELISEIDNGDDAMLELYQEEQLNGLKEKIGKYREFANLILKKR